MWSVWSFRSLFVASLLWCVPLAVRSDSGGRDYCLCWLNAVRLCSLLLALPGSARPESFGVFWPSCFGSWNDCWLELFFVLVVFELKLENAVSIIWLICVSEKLLISLRAYCFPLRSWLLDETKNIHFPFIDLPCSSAVNKRIYNVVLFSIFMIIFQSEDLWHLPPVLISRREASGHLHIHINNHLHKSQTLRSGARRVCDKAGTAVWPRA